jgi:hypothetical protein
MKYPTFNKVVIENEVYTDEENVAKAIMQWKTSKDYLEQDVTTLRKFTLNELKLRAGYAESLFENEEEYKKAISAVMAVERSLKR